MHIFVLNGIRRQSSLSFSPCPSNFCDDSESSTFHGRKLFLFVVGLNPNRAFQTYHLLASRSDEKLHVMPASTSGNQLSWCMRRHSQQHLRTCLRPALHLTAFHPSGIRQGKPFSGPASIVEESRSARTRRSYTTGLRLPCILSLSHVPHRQRCVSTPSLTAVHGAACECEPSHHRS